MTRRPITLPGLGVVNPTAGPTTYRTAEPISTDDVRELIRQKWVHTVQVSDGQGGGPEFYATCELNGTSFVVTGEIGSC